MVSIDFMAVLGIQNSAQPNPSKSTEAAHTRRCSRTDASVASLPLASAAERQYRWADNVEMRSAPFDLRKRVRWKRAVLIVVLIVLPVAVVKWPCVLLPLRWQYGLIRDADAVIAVADRLTASLHRPPTSDELMRTVPDPLIADRLNYAPDGEGYRLFIVCGFDCSVGYESRTGLWK